MAHSIQERQSFFNFADTMRNFYSINLLPAFVVDDANPAPQQKNNTPCCCTLSTQNLSSINPIFHTLIQSHTASIQWMICNFKNGSQVWNGSWSQLSCSSPAPGALRTAWSTSLPRWDWPSPRPLAVMFPHPTLHLHVQMVLKMTAAASTALITLSLRCQQETPFHARRVAMTWTFIVHGRSRRFLIQALVPPPLICTPKSMHPFTRHLKWIHVAGASSRSVVQFATTGRIVMSSLSFSAVSAHRQHHPLMADIEVAAGTIPRGSAITHILMKGARKEMLSGVRWTKSRRRPFGNEERYFVLFILLEIRIRMLHQIIPMSLM